MKVENKLKFFNLLGHRIILASKYKYCIWTPQKIEQSSFYRTKVRKHTQCYHHSTLAPT